MYGIWINYIIYFHFKLNKNYDNRVHKNDVQETVRDKNIFGFQVEQPPNTKCVITD